MSLFYFAKDIIPYQYIRKVLIGLKLNSILFLIKNIITSTPITENILYPAFEHLDRQKKIYKKRITDS